MEMVVCKKVRYPITSKGKVDKTYPSKTLKERSVISREFVEKWNKEYAPQNGVVYIVNEKATKEYYSNCKNQNEKRKATKEMEKTVALGTIGQMANLAAAQLISNKEGEGNNLVYENKTGE